MLNFFKTARCTHVPTIPFHCQAFSFSFQEYCPNYGHTCVFMHKEPVIRMFMVNSYIIQSPSLLQASLYSTHNMMVYGHLEEGSGMLSQFAFFLLLGNFFNPNRVFMNHKEACNEEFFFLVVEV